MFLIEPVSIDSNLLLNEPLRLTSSAVVLVVMIKAKPNEITESRISGVLIQVRYLSFVDCVVVIEIDAQATSSP